MDEDGLVAERDGNAEAAGGGAAPAALVRLTTTAGRAPTTAAAGLDTGLGVATGGLLLDRDGNAEAAGAVGPAVLSVIVLETPAGAAPNTRAMLGCCVGCLDLPDGAPDPAPVLLEPLAFPKLGKSSAFGGATRILGADGRIEALAGAPERLGKESMDCDGTGVNDGRDDALCEGPATEEEVRDGGFLGGFRRTQTSTRASRSSSVGRSAANSGSTLRTALRTPNVSTAAL